MMRISVLSIFLNFVISFSEAKSKRYYSASFFGVTEKNVEVFLEDLIGKNFSASQSQLSAKVVTSRKLSLPLGYVQGRPCLKYPSVTEFLGIPFAEPLLGNARFTLPVLYNSTYPSPHLDATSHPPPCGSICGHMGKRVLNQSSEDCLFLNIWVPSVAVPNKTKLPVKVGIHGGAVTECSASDPNLAGCDFVYKENIIQVNIQFRLGVFGYLAHPETITESNTTGNWGLIDQQLALKWIQKHISYFGGDPTKVTINGNSAGAQRVDFHTVLPGSKGLFHAAISQSPPCVHFLDLDQAYAISEDFIVRAGCSQPLNASAELACLRSLPWEFLQNLSRSIGEERPQEIVMCEAINWRSYFHHVIDGTTVPLQVSTALATNQYNDVPYMVGTNTADGREFVEMFFITNNILVTNQTAYEVLQTVYPGANPEPIVALYPLSDYLDRFDPPRARLTALWTDLFFTCPVYERLVARNVFNPDTKTFAYLFNASPTCPPADVFYGPTHAAELMYANGVTTGLYPPSGTCNFTESEVILSKVITHGWSTMSDSGSPKWEAGGSWVQWSPLVQNVTFLDRFKATTMHQDYASRCRVIQRGIQESVLASLDPMPYVPSTSK